jgi:hypothetical protein
MTRLSAGFFVRFYFLEFINAQLFAALQHKKCVNRRENPLVKTPDRPFFQHHRVYTQAEKHRSCFKHQLN